MPTVVTDVAGLKFRYGVRSVEDGDGRKTWDGGCSCGFHTTGWPTRVMATERITMHAAEHESGEAMIELVDFKFAVGYDTGVVPATDTPFPVDDDTDGGE